MRKVAEDGQRNIEIPQIQLARMMVTIQGLTPLITHRFGDRAISDMEGKQQKQAKMAKEARDPDADFRDSLYFTREGRHAVPGAALKKALVTAGGRFASETMTVLRGVLSIEGDYLEIKGSEPVMRSDTVRLPNGAANIAYRPMFSPWEVGVPVVFNVTMISQAQVVNLFQLAGFSVGIGDWRPEKNGTFGQFRIKGVEEIPWK